MSESYDYDPGGWSGHDFTRSRASYDTHARRSYAQAQESGVTASDVVPNRITTSARRPLIIAVDVTGSMGTWPATMFGKLPLLAMRAMEYLGPDTEISFMAINDGPRGARYPLQVRNFSAGPAMAAEIEALIVEGGGGSNSEESYELAALYACRNVDFTHRNADPIFIFVADESPYDSCPVARARSMAKVTIPRKMSTRDIYAELKSKYDTYLVYKTYTGSRPTWEALVGNDRIADLEDPNRIVDVILGILGTSTDKTDKFKADLEDRQTPAQVNTVYEALRTIHRNPRLRVMAGVDEDALSLPTAAHSTLHRPTGGTDSGDLM